MSEYLTFSKFQTNEEARELTALLEKANIAFTIESERNPLDAMYVGQSLDPLVVLKIPQERFKEANEILLEHAKTQLTDIDPDYYLFEFSNQELLGVLKDPNEWNHLDRARAQKLLTERGVETSHETEYDASHLAFKPYHLDGLVIFVEYLFAILFAYVGILIGLATLLAYKTLSNGKKVKLYDLSTRKHAEVMLILGIGRIIYHYSYLFSP